MTERKRPEEAPGAARREGSRDATSTIASVWVEPDGTHIDVRGLPAPQPMVQILSLLQQLPRSTVVTVHHERDPVWLYPELVQIGWWADRIPGEPGEVRLRLTATP